MNPFALLIVVVALLLFVVAFKGTQDNVISALLGRQYGNAQLGQGTAAPVGPQPTSYVPTSTIPQIVV